MTKAELGYLAGIIDGEGSIGIKKHDRKRPNGESYRIFAFVIGAGNTDKALIDWVYAKTRVGYISPQNRPYPWNVLYQWRAQGNDATKILRMILPYLLCKKTRAELALMFQKTNDHSSYNRWKLMPHRIYQKRKNYYLMMRNINGALGNGKIVNKMEYCG